MASDSPGTTRQAPAAPPRLSENFLVLHFMVQLTMTEDADVRLSERRLGRVHHRILYFVHFAPGIGVGELLQALNVKHQNIQAPLRHLINEGYIVSRPSAQDGRVKLLHCSAKGEKLLRFISQDQRERIERVYDSVSSADIASYFKVMAAMLDEHRRDWGRLLMDGEDPA